MSTSEDRKKYWEKYYLSFTRSGLTQREFCRQNKISYWSFNHWKKRFDKTKSDVSLQEIPLRIPEKLNGNKSIEIILKNNIRLSIPENFSHATLKQVIAVLGGYNENQLG